MKWFALSLCLLQLSIQSLCCCFLQTSHCEPVAPEQAEMPACHQPTPACHSAESENIETKAQLKKLCMCEQDTVDFPTNLTALSAETPPISWQLPPYQQASNTLSLQQFVAAKNQQQRRFEQVNLVQGRSAPELCRFLI